ncbi:MAG: DUF4926 domain-containing protein [Eubacteriales bacterium]|nr:DUF4926 domain-containing protein [Eubacteriales bacterium]
MNELDVVKLIKDLDDIPKGTEGTIAHKYDKTNFEAEFFDDKLDTIDVVTTSAEYLELVKTY